MKTGAVILAAGHKSSVSEFQPMLRVGDTTVIKRIIITLKRAGVEPIVVITGRQGEELEKHIAKMRVIALRNEEYASAQMFDSVRMGVHYLKDVCDRVLVMPTKYPMLLKETMERILESGAQLACPVFEGRRGHPVMISKEWMAKLLSYEGKNGLSGFLKQPEAEAVLEEIEVDDQGIIQAVETDEDRASAMESMRHKRIPMHPKVSVYLECDEQFFGPGIAQFLSLIEHTGSMQTACRQMHMSYSKGWKILKTAERQLGYPLLVTQSGGENGGFSQLTARSKCFLERFLAMEQEMERESKRLFLQYFGEGEKEDEGII